MSIIVCVRCGHIPGRHGSDGCEWMVNPTTRCPCKVKGEGGFAATGVDGLCARPQCGHRRGAHMPHGRCLAGGMLSGDFCGCVGFVAPAARLSTANPPPTPPPSGSVPVNRAGGLTVAQWARAHGFNAAATWAASLVPSIVEQEGTLTSRDVETLALRWARLIENGESE